MRLGDLDALKEKLSGANYQTWTHEYGYAIPTEWVMNAIDNAPTVAVNCKDCDGYEAGYSAGLKDAERPQGEWEKFARWVAKEVLDNYFEESSGAFAEIACRKLVKLGLVEVKDNVYKMKGGKE